MFRNPYQKPGKANTADRFSLSGLAAGLFSLSDPNDSINFDWMFGALEQRLVHNHDDPNETDGLGRTPLMYAIAGNEIFKNFTLPFNENQYAQIIQTLLDHGADPRLQDNKGKSVVEYAYDKFPQEHRVLTIINAWMDEHQDLKPAHSAS